MRQHVADRSWVRQAFMVPEENLDEYARKERTYSSVRSKFTDTRLGGNFAVNTPSGYTEYADIVNVNRSFNQLGRNSTGGMGRFYSEQIDDNSQLIHMSFGVPAYNGLTTFFTGFYDGTASYLARTGRSPGVFYRSGQILGFVVSLNPLLATFILAGHTARFLMDAPASKYYYMKRTMVPYWQRVNSIANMMAVNLKLVPPVYDTADKDRYRDEEYGGQWSAEDIKSFHDMAPDIFSPSGGVDVYSIANRAQRIAYIHYEKLREIYGIEDIDELTNSLDKYRYEQDVYVKYDARQTGIVDYTKLWLDSEGGQMAAGSETELENWVEKTGRPELPSKEGRDPNDTSWWEEALGWTSSKIDEFSEYAMAELRDGGQFVTFRVDESGPVQESFTNSVGESNIQQKINSASSSARSARFDVADGNTGIGLIDGVMGAFRDFVGGVADQIQISGLFTLFGSAFVDIPKQWQDSSADLPQANFTIQLRSWSGDPISQFQNIYIPLAMLLAAALPISTGKASYTSPFLTELYSRGKHQIKLGMITSLSINRGTSNLAFNDQWQANAIDVSFTVTDMSSIMHMPMTSAYTSWLDGLLDSESAFADYMAVVTGLSLNEQVYPTRKLLLNMTRAIKNFKSHYTLSRISQSMANWDIVRGAINPFTLVTARGVEN